MNPDRRKPPDNVDREYLDLWLSGVIWDAIRDVRMKGLPDRFIAYMLINILASVGCDAWGSSAACIRKFTEHFKRGNI